MKTVLAVLGVIAFVAIAVIGGGGYYAYKKASSAVVDAGQVEIEKFISTKHPSEQVSGSFRRLMNAVKLKHSWATTVLVGLAMGSIQDGVVTLEEEKMVDEAAQLAEHGNVGKEKIAEFIKKYEKTMAHRGLGK